MTTQTTTRIEELQVAVQNANTANADGRQIVANACKELYNSIEEDVYNSGKEWMLEGMYNDLCASNFAEPFMCERKKSDFETIKKIYENNVLPNLQQPC